MAEDNSSDKKLRDIISRLDLIILQQEDRPEVYTMQRVSKNISNIDVTTTSINETLNNAFKATTKQTKDQQTLFQRVMQNFAQSSNKIRAAVISLTDIIKTTLDFKGHLSRISNSIDQLKVTARMQFARMQEGFSRWFEKVVFRFDEMKRLVGLQRDAAQDLNSFLSNSSGNDAPLTVGYISALYKKIFAYQVVTENRNRKTEQLRYKSMMKVERSQLKTLKAIATHLIGKKLGWIAKAIQLFGIGLVFIGGQLMSLGGALAGASMAATRFRTLGMFAANVLTAFGKFGSGTGNIVQKLATNFSGTMFSFMTLIVRQVFSGLLRTVAMLFANPLVLLGALAGYGIYKLIEDEVDRIFVALKSIFGDPKKREMLMNIISQWFTDTLHSIGAWFGVVGDNIKDAVPQEAIDGVMSGFDKMMQLVKNTFALYTGMINGVIASFLSVPDSFRLFMIAIEELMLNIKGVAVDLMNALPDWAKSDGMENFIKNANIEGGKKDLQDRKDQINARLDERYNTDYLSKAADGVVDGAKMAGQAIVDGAKSTVDMLKSPVDSLANSTESLDKFLQAEVEKKQAEDEARIRAVRQQMIADGVKNVHKVSNAAILEAIAMRDAAAREARNAGQLGSQFITNAINSVQNSTHLTMPVSVSSDARETGNSARGVY